MTTVREPAVAGTFYPNDAATLCALISDYLDGETGLDCAKAIIAPHAGCIYSGANYGTWRVTEVSKQNVDKWSLADKQTLLRLAREAIRSPLEGEKISILTQPRRLPASSQEDLVSKLQPGIDGLIIKEGSHQATYLPSAWQHILDPRQFIAELRVKAGLDAQGWQNTEVFTYSTEELY